ncbi:MAG: hypothetical protein KC561_10095, partial [Myxococcales bacterium]|nr:hypothetical protein [Myxococcales bacterium]
MLALKTGMRVLAATATLVLLGNSAVSQTGVSDDRVSLPEGPGSLEGVGDDVDIDPNMGTMSYVVPMSIPGGFEGLTPTIGLGYSSGAGSGIAGIGWGVDLPSIERLTIRGVPNYEADDEFQAAGAQLVLVDSEDGVNSYRARCEGGFSRYSWHDVGDGSEGYFVAERPDGTVWRYGADREGNLVESARYGDPELVTFRYLPVTCWDGYDHHVDFSYGTYGGTQLIEQIDWVFTGGSGPLYKLDFEYESREDWISNATGGFEEVLQHRLTDVIVSVGGTQRNRYELVYESYEASGGFSRLAEVVTYGVGDAEYPASFTFQYSAGLGGECTGEACETPYVATM